MVISECQKNSSNRYQGIFLASLSSFFFSLCTTIVKALYYIDPGQMAAFRFASIFVISLPILVYKGYYPLGTSAQRPFLFLRGLFSACNIYFSFQSFRNLPLGVASVICFSYPIFVAVLARIFLKEKFDLPQSAAGVLNLVGLVAMCKFSVDASLDPRRVYGLACAFASVLLGSMGYVLLGKLREVDEAVMLFNLSWMGTFASGAVTVILGEFSSFECSRDSLLIIAFALFCFFGQYLLVFASRREKAAVVATMRSATDIVFSFLWQVVFFGDVPDAYNVTGAVLVCFSIVLIGYQKRTSTEKK